MAQKPSSGNQPRLVFDYDKFLRKWRERIDTGRYTECEKLCLKGLSMHPGKQDRSKLYNHLGYLYENFLDDKTFDDILEQYVLSLQVDHTNPAAHYNLAAFLLDQSVTHLERAVELKPSHKKAKRKLDDLLRSKATRSTASAGTPSNQSQSELLPIKTILQIGDEAFRIEERTLEGYKCVPLKIKVRGTRNKPSIYDEKRGAQLVDVRHDIVRGGSRQDLSPSRARNNNNRLPTSKSATDLRRGGSYSSMRDPRDNVPRINLPEFDEEKDDDDGIEYSYGRPGAMRGKERPNRVRDIQTPRQKSSGDADQDTDAEYSQSRSRLGSANRRSSHSHKNSSLPSQFPNDVPIQKIWPQCLCGWTVLAFVGVIVTLTGVLSRTTNKVFPRGERVVSRTPDTRPLNVVFVMDCSVAAVPFANDQIAAAKNFGQFLLSDPSAATQNLKMWFFQSCGGSPSGGEVPNLNSINSSIDSYVGSFIAPRSALTEMAPGIDMCRTRLTGLSTTGSLDLCVTFNVFPPSDLANVAVSIRALMQERRSFRFLQVAVRQNATLFAILGSLGASASAASNSTNSPIVEASFTSSSCTSTVTDYCAKTCTVDAPTSNPNFCGYRVLMNSLVSTVAMSYPPAVLECTTNDEALFAMFLLLPMMAYGIWLSCTMSRTLILAASSPRATHRIDPVQSRSGRAKAAGDREETTTLDTTLGKEASTNIEDGPNPREREVESETTSRSKRPPPKPDIKPTPNSSLGGSLQTTQDDDKMSFVDDDVSYSGELVRIEFPQDEQPQGKLSAYV